MDTKTCTKCGETKPLEEFYRRAAAGNGRCARCKACMRADHQRWLAENRAYRNHYQSEWQKNNPRRKEYMRRYYARKREETAA